MFAVNIYYSLTAIMHTIYQLIQFNAFTMCELLFSQIGGIIAV
jgi:hypothetical protein